MQGVDRILSTSNALAILIYKAAKRSHPGRKHRIEGRGYQRRKAGIRVFDRSHVSILQRLAPMLPSATQRGLSMSSGKIGKKFAGANNSSGQRFVTRYEHSPLDFASKTSALLAVLMN